MKSAGSNRRNGYLEGRYVNYFEIGHNAFEFLFDFGQLYPEDHDADLHTRIVVSPAYAKDLAAVLNDAIRQYEQCYGKLPDQTESEADYGKAPRKKTGRTLALKVV